MKEEPKSESVTGGGQMERGMTNQELMKLMADTEELCGKLYELRNEPRFSRLCVNWGDFGCVEAMWCRNESGMEWPVVKLSEASPDGNEVAYHYFRDALISKGYSNHIEVRMEW